MAKTSTDKTADQDTQLARFQKAARELHTDDSEEAFDRALKRVAERPNEITKPLGKSPK